MKATLIVLQNDSDHAQAKALVEKLMQSDTPEEDARLAAQARLIEAYERGRWPRRKPGPAEILTYLMEQHGLSRADLVPLLGTSSRVSEVLAGKRDLSMTMVRRLRERFDISADALIPRMPVSRARKRIAA
jgi:HTH-type transcriptional regulator/antitoxin HigA